MRETVAAPLPVVWQFLLSAGIPIWLGRGEFRAQKGFQYAMADGVRGEVRSYTEGSKVRLSWRPEDWPHDTVLMISVKEVETGTTIAIHHEELADRAERRMMLGHWKNVIEDLAAAF
ncbi:MAG: activator of Hsp90 ATPase 1 family protein [Microbacteriaceae bacterium]|nr:activator of Hsp90 ATPase 1 family protein [Microbacteriaceae bacterium]